MIQSKAIEDSKTINIAKLFETIKKAFELRKNVCRNQGQTTIQFTLVILRLKSFRRQQSLYGPDGWRVVMAVRGCACDCKNQ